MNGKSLSKTWLLAHESDWRRLEQLLDHAEKLPAKELHEMGFLYRSVLNDLNRIRSTPGYSHLEPYLNNLTLRCHAHVYAQPPLKWRNIADFLLLEFPQAFRRHARLIGLAFLLFVAGSALAFWTLQVHPEMETTFMPESVISDLKHGILWMEDRSAAPSEATFLMSNNIRVAFNAYVGGIFFGVGTLLAMFYNGLYAFGGPLGVCALHGMAPKLLKFVYAHSVIELTTIFIAGGAGMLVGLALIFPGDLPRWTALRLRAKESLVLVLGCVPLLIIAGLIEGLVSMNPAVPTHIRLIIAGLSALMLTLYLGFSGRSTPS